MMFFDPLCLATGFTKFTLVFVIFLSPSKIFKKNKLYLSLAPESPMFEEAHRIWKTPSLVRDTTWPLYLMKEEPSPLTDLNRSSLKSSREMHTFYPLFTPLKMITEPGPEALGSIRRLWGWFGWRSWMKVALSGSHQREKYRVKLPSSMSKFIVSWVRSNCLGS